MNVFYLFKVIFLKKLLITEKLFFQLSINKNIIIIIQKCLNLK